MNAYDNVNLSGYDSEDMRQRAANLKIEAVFFRDLGRIEAAEECMELAETLERMAAELEAERSNNE